MVISASAGKDVKVESDMLISSRIWGLANSGINLLKGSSSSNLPYLYKIIAATDVTGLVIDASLNISSFFCLIDFSLSLNPNDLL